MKIKTVFSLVCPSSAPLSSGCNLNELHIMVFVTFMYFTKSVKYTGQVDEKEKAKAWKILIYSLGSMAIEKEACKFFLGISLGFRYVSFNYNEVGVHRAPCLKCFNFVFSEKTNNVSRNAF